MRSTIQSIVAHPQFTRIVMGVIIFNAFLLGLETSERVMAESGTLIRTLDQICLGFFVVEIILKLIALGRNFFKDGWNIFDTLIVAVSLVPASEGFSILRAMRVLRVVRIISVAPRLRRVIEGFINALPGMTSVFLLMGLIFYVGSVMATKLFGGLFPEWFGSIGSSAYSLFQIMTLESWSMGIVRPVMIEYPWAWTFFVPFILITTFAVMNLVVGLIVNSLAEAHSEEADAAQDKYREEVLVRLEAIEKRLSERS